MPEEYRNPYDFVPLEGSLQRDHSYIGLQDATSGLTGKVVCTLGILTPVFIGTGEHVQKEGQTVYLPARLADAAYLPASSLKGMLRSILETVSNSCLGVLSAVYGRVDMEAQNRVPSGYRRCVDHSQLCQACAIFGMVEGEREANTDKKKIALAGRVWVSDGKATDHVTVPTVNVILPGRLDRNESVVPVGNPKPGHEPFYFDSNGAMLGRKFYYRTNKWEEILRTDREDYRRLFGNRYRDIILRAIPSDQATFEFDVHFQNLSADELDLLLYSLCLEEGMCHHLGYGKPFGLGSVRVAEAKVAVLKREEDDGGPALFLKYSSSDAWELRTSSVDADRVWKRKDATASSRAERSRRKLKDILKWPRSELFFYPQFYTGPGQKNRNLETIRLAAYQTGVRTPGELIRSSAKTQEVHPAEELKIGSRYRGRVVTKGGQNLWIDISGTRAYLDYKELKGVRLSDIEVGDQLEFVLAKDATGYLAKEATPVSEGRS